jgi:hypothetical protein
MERNMRKYAVTAALVGVLALVSTGVAGQAVAAAPDVAGKKVACSNQGGAQHHKVYCVNVSPSINVDINVSRVLNDNEINILVIELNKLDLDIDAKLLVVQIENTVIAVLSKFDIVIGPNQINTCVKSFCG